MKSLEEAFAEAARKTWEMMDLQSKLSTACCNPLDNPEVVKQLINDGADIHADDEECLVMAALNWNPRVGEYILSLEPDLYWITHSNSDVRLAYKMLKEIINEIEHTK